MRNQRNDYDVLVIVVRVEPARDGAGLPAVAVDPPEDLAAALRAANILATPRRRPRRLFDEFVSVVMPAPWPVARRRERARPGAGRGSDTMPA